MTPEEHQKSAEELLSKAWREGQGMSVQQQLNMIGFAAVHAILALRKDEQ